MTRRLLAGLVAAVLVAVGPLAAMDAAGRTPRASAATTPATTPATISVDTLDPALATEGSTLRVAGNVANTGRQELRHVEVRVRLSATPLGSRSELTAVVRGDTTSQDGEVVASSSLPDLGPGQTEAFELSRAMDQLAELSGSGVSGVGVSGVSGVYVVGIEVLAARDSGFGRVAIVRTPLPWFPETPELVPTSFAWLWPLVGRPVRLADGTFTDDSLATDLGPGGRLTRLLDAGARLPSEGVTWAIDPELVAAVGDMADGYQVRAQDGSLSDGSGAAAAQAWLATLQSVTAGAEVIPLPYSDADVSAMTRADFGPAATSAMQEGLAPLVAALPEALVLDEATWPIDGYVSRPALGALARSGVSTVVLDGRALPPTLDLSYTPTGRANVTTRSGRVAAVLAEPGLTDLLAARSTQPLLAASRLLAETAMIAAELPSGPQRSILLMPPRRWDPDPAFLDRLAAVVTDAPWMSATSLGSIAGQSPPEVDREPLRYPRDQREAELPESYLSAVDSMRDSTALFATILTEPEEYVPALERSALLLQSGWWRDRQGRTNRLARERDYLADLRARVRVQPAGFTFSSRSGTIAVTVANELSQSVLVTLRLQPQTTRLRLEEVVGRPIGPNQKQQVEVPATAVAPGTVAVTATLHTPNGTQYGQPVSLRITITEYGTVALYITIAAAAVLFLAAGVRVVRRVRQR